jgi:hypothetical protein
MPRVQVGYEPGAAALQTTASPNQQAIKARFDPRSSSAFQLAEALGKAEPVIENIQQKMEREKFIETQLQMLKKESYQQQFSRDQTGGGVSAVQVGEKNPETVPIIRAQVAEGVGQERGKDLANPVIQGVLQDENLRLDTDARAAHLKTKREEFIASLKGDDFYKSGAISAYDKEIQQYENAWQRDTANYHYKKLEDKLAREVGETLDNKGDLLKLDDAWKNNNGLNNTSRNKIVVDTVVSKAFSSLDPKMLDNIPDRFLNEESKAKVQQMRLKIQEVGMTYARDRAFLQNQQREEALRKNKIEMIDTVVGGGQVDPAKYKDDDQSFQYAMTMKDAGKIPEAQSAASARMIRSKILASATTDGVDPKVLSDQVLADKTLNPADKKKLIEEMPKLVEGVIAMQDDAVKSAFSTRIGASLDGLEKSVNQTIARIVTGTNLRAKAVGMFDAGIRSGFNSYYQENGGKWPVGKAKQDIIDREIEKAERFIETQVRVSGAGTSTAPAPAA